MEVIKKSKFVETSHLHYRDIEYKTELMDNIIDELVTPNVRSIMTDSGSIYDSSEEDSDRSRRKKSKNRRTVKSRRNRLLAYHQRLVKERGYPLSRFQLRHLSSKNKVYNNPSSGTSLIKGRKLENEFCKMGDQFVEEEEAVGEQVQGTGEPEVGAGGEEQVLSEGKEITPEAYQEMD